MPESRQEIYTEIEESKGFDSDEVISLFNEMISIILEIGEKDGKG